MKVLRDLPNQRPQYSDDLGSLLALGIFCYLRKRLLGRPRYAPLGKPHGERGNALRLDIPFDAHPRLIFPDCGQRNFPCTQQGPFVTVRVVVR